MRRMTDDQPEGLAGQALGWMPASAGDEIFHFVADVNGRVGAAKPLTSTDSAQGVPAPVGR